MHSIVILVALSVFGAIVGSFLNVLIVRMHTGKSCGGRSGCLSCAHTLSWRELFPIVSFFALRARCAHCGSRISWQYPLVELSSAILFSMTFLLHMPLIASVCALGIVASLVVIAVYDMHHTIIPSIPLYVFFAFAIVFRLVTDVDVLSIVYGATATAAPLAFLWLASSGRAMGFGDVKLALGMGAVLGIAGGLQALLLAFVSGAIVGITLVTIPKLTRSFGGKRISMKSEIPFAPFLILGFFVLFFFGLDIIHIVWGT